MRWPRNTLTPRLQPGKTNIWDVADYARSLQAAVALSGVWDDLPLVRVSEEPFPSGLGVYCLEANQEMFPDRSAMIPVRTEELGR